tara:strand:- start:41 stop:484 length:444 start_codon:yes stop_codon:yes gene_type:complete
VKTNSFSTTKEKIAFSILNVFISTKSQREDVWVTPEAIYNAYSSFLLPLLDECVPQLASRKNLAYSDVSSLGKGFFRSSPFFQDDHILGILYHTGRNTRTIMNGKQMLVLGSTDLIQAPEDTLRDMAQQFGISWWEKWRSIPSILLN